MRVLGLGFKRNSDGHDLLPHSAFICQELCLGGSLRSLVLRQMCNPFKVCDKYWSPLSLVFRPVEMYVIR